VSGRRVTSVRAEAFRAADRMEVWIRRECLMRPSRTRARAPSTPLPFHPLFSHPPNGKSARAREGVTASLDTPTYIWYS